MKKYLLRLFGFLLILSFLAAPPLAAQAAPEEKILQDAALLPQGELAVLYLDGSGLLHYGVLNPRTQAWQAEGLIPAQEAALALDAAGNPHIAYIDPAHQLGYLYHKDGWSEPVFIQSHGSTGELFAPDLAIDAAGCAHIVYMDTEGGHDFLYDTPEYDKADLIYTRHCESSGFEEEYIHYSHGFGDMTPDYESIEYIEIKAPPKIALWDNRPYIGALSHSYFYDAWGFPPVSAHLHALEWAYPLPPKQHNLSEEDLPEAALQLFDIRPHSSGVYALMLWEDRLSVVDYTDTSKEIAAARKAFNPQGAGLFADAGGLYYAAVPQGQADTLLLYQNGHFKEGLPLPAKMAAESRLLTLVDEDCQFILYQDEENRLWLGSISVEPGIQDFSVFQLEEKQAEIPVILEAQIPDKPYDACPALYPKIIQAREAEGNTPITGLAYHYTWEDAAGKALPAAPVAAGDYQLIITISEESLPYTGSIRLPFSITPRPLTLKGLTAVSRAYNGLNQVELSGGTLEGIMGEDAVTALIPPFGLLEDANAGENKAVIPAEILLTGADAANYALIQPDPLQANIIPAKLTLLGAGIAPKAYDGSPQAAVNALVFSGLQNGEVLTLGQDYTAAAAFAAAQAGADIPVTGLGQLLASPKAANYYLANTDFTASGDILKAAGLLAFAPPEIKLHKNRGLDYTYPLTEIQLNKSDTGTIQYSLGELKGDALFSAAPKLNADGKTLRFTAAPVKTGRAEQSILIRSHNYQDISLSLNFGLLDKTPAYLEGIQMADKIYDGSPALYSGLPQAKAAADDAPLLGLEYLYTWQDAAGNILPAAPGAAGDYALLVEVDSLEYEGSLLCPFAIHKKPLLIKPGDYTIQTKEMLPAPALIYTGLIPGESPEEVIRFTPAPVLEIRDNTGHALASSTIRGSYAIVIANQPLISAPNYEITLAEGLLTINRATVFGGAGESPAQSAPLPAPIIQGDTPGMAASMHLSVSPALGQGEVEIAPQTLSALLKKAQEGGEIQNSTVLGMEIEAAGPLRSLSVNLPGPQIGTIAQNGLALAIHSPLLSLTFDAAALEALAQAAAEDSLMIYTGMADAPALSPVQQEKTAGCPIYELTVSSKGKKLAHFGGGQAAVSIPYGLAAGENPYAIVVWHLKEDGSLEMLPSRYDAEKGRIIFIAPHFSLFAIAHQPVSFRDVPENAWYKDALDFCAARGIAAGLGNGLFAPDAYLSRGDFLVLLLRAYGIEPDENPLDNFSDAGQTYYTGYLASAKRLGIAGGVAYNQFAPEERIQRQELFTLLYRTLKILGKAPDNSEGQNLKAFADEEQIADYARQALESLVSAGIITGSEGKLAPRAPATRSQMVHLLFQLLNS